MKFIASFLIILLVTATLASDQLKGTAAGVDREKRILKILVDGAPVKVRITDQTRFEMNDGAPMPEAITLDEPYWSSERLKVTVETETKDGDLVATVVRVGILMVSHPAPESKHVGPSASSLLGKPLPRFLVPTTDGKTISNKSLYGKVVLLDFWATWCVPCRKVSPYMQRLHEKYGSRGLVVIGANCFEQPDNKTNAPALAYAKEHNYTYPFAFRADDLAKKCYIEAIPTLLLVDKKGVLRKVQVDWDEASDQAFTQAIERLLKQ